MSFQGSGFGSPFGFSITPWVKRLLIANIAVFLLTWIVGKIPAVAGVLGYLPLVPSQVLARPWTVLTYMFVHGGLFHLLFNMLGLLFFGPPLEERWGSREFLKYYLIAGIGGALFSFIFPNQAIVGASGAVYGIMLAFAMYWPDNPIYIWGILPVKAKWLVLFLFLLSLFSAMDGGASGVAHLAHLGGLVTGFAFLKSPWGPSPWGEPLQTPKRRRFTVLTGARRSQAKPAASAPARPTAPAAWRAGEEDVLSEVDRILEKISAHGLASLSPEERRVLDDASRRGRH